MGGGVIAGIVDKLAGVMLFVFGGLIRGLMSLIGELVLSVTNMLILVAQYNGFIKSQAVTVGWVVVRDIANMFFIIILLVIAIMTILNLESLPYKKALPKLLLMAVFINFSKTICGIIIDFGQVVMLTFVNAFKAAAGANFIQAFGLDQVMSFAASTPTYDDAAVMGTMLLGLIVLLVALGTMLTLLVVLIARIIVLWILVILSPFAFLLAASPFGAEYAKEWWKNFTSYVISGPILAFFIWLSLIVAGAGTGNTQVNVMSVNPEGSTTVTASALGTLEKLSSVIVATAMLLIGLGVTKKLQVAGSGMAGAVIDSAKKVGTMPWRAVKKTGSWAYGKTKSGIKGGLETASDITYATTGLALPFSERRQKAKEGRRKNIRQMREAEGMAKTAERMAGGRALWASMIDPRAAGKVTPWEMAKATVGGEGAQARVRRAGDSLAGAAVSEMRSVDPFQAKELEMKTDAAMGERLARPQIMEQQTLQQQEVTYKKDLADQDKKITANDSRRTVLTAEEEGLDRLYQQSNDDIISDRAGQRFAVEQREAQKKGETLPAGRLQKLFNEEKGKSLREAMDRAGKGATQERVDQEYDTVLREPILKRKEEVAKERQGLEANRPRLEKEHDSLDSALKQVSADLKKVSFRLANPESAGFETKQLRDQRREAVAKGKTDEVKKIDIELKKIEQTSGMLSVKLAENWGKMSYGEKLTSAKKDAEGMSDANLAKVLAASFKDGKLTRDDFDKFTKKWREEGAGRAREALEDFLKQKAAAAAPAAPTKP